MKPRVEEFVAKVKANPDCDPANSFWWVLKTTQTSKTRIGEDTLSFLEQLNIEDEALSQAYNTKQWLNACLVGVSQIQQRCRRNSVRQREQCIANEAKHRTREFFPSLSKSMEGAAHYSSTQRSDTHRIYVRTRFFGSVA